MAMRWKTFTQILLRRNVWIMLFLGFSSGLPLALVGGTLQAWLTTAGVSLVDIGFFSLIGIPYLYKFAWSPVLDRYSLFKLGRRRGWMLLTQAGLILSLYLMSITNPHGSCLLCIGLLAFIVASLSATQDTAIDAYRTDLLKVEERGLGSGIFVAGWRIGYLLSGGLALIIAKYAGWHATYMLMAIAMFIGFITTLAAPKTIVETQAPKNIQDAFIKPFKEFLTRPLAIGILVFVILFKLGDAFALTFMTTFLLRLGFDLAFIGSIFKIFGVIATVAGGVYAGALMTRLGLYKSLLWFGILQASASILLVLLAYVGKNDCLMIVTIIYESFTTGMASTAFMAFLMSLCNHHYTATQYALLSALAAIGRVLLGPLAGVMAACCGWMMFFFISLVLAIPGLMLLIWLNTKLKFDTAQ